MIIQRITGLLLLLTVATSVASVQDAGTIAFSGAEGYGRYSQGGRGGEVYIVANRKADGKAFLRYGIENQSGATTAPAR